MKFSTRTTYGLRAMIFLAKNWNNENISLPTIAKKEKISLGYLERIFSHLKEADLIKAEKGVAGGYKLSRHPSRIKIYEITKVLEGKIIPFHCLSENGKILCKKEDGCGVTKMLLKVQDSIILSLKSLSLSDLL